MNIIKNTLCLGVITFIAIGSISGASAKNDVMHENHGKSSMEQNYTMGKGIIQNIDIINSKINISHDAIPELKWPKMTMDINVADNVDLKTLSPNNVINFHIELGEDNVYRITKIMKLENLGLKYLQHTENKYICMVNNKRFDKVQIPTEVNGNTYYGCCSMCKAKLEKSQELREATDPISGNVVDKAIAVIGTAPDGAAYYFENKENMTKFDELKSSHSNSEHNHKH